LLGFRIKDSGLAYSSRRQESTNSLSALKPWQHTHWIEAITDNFLLESVWLWQWWHRIVVGDLDCCLPVDEHWLQ